MALPHFFSIVPLEIRLQIYEYLLNPEPKSPAVVSVALEQDYQQVHDLALVYTKESWASVDLNVLRTNKRIYEEALPILYQRCIFNPTADEDVLSMFFGRMSSFACSNVRRLLLKPKPQVVRRVGGSKTNISELRRAALWAPACAKIHALLPELREVQIDLHPMYAYQLESSGDVGWLTIPLSLLQGVKKSLVRVSKGSAEFTTVACAEKWDQAVAKADLEKAEYLSCKNRVMRSQNGWPVSYWRMKRSGFPLDMPKGDIDFV
ncbi:hypothetical protein F4859DRAFT_174288 [Xylaria cf. heliscus]|nr:hypothetical protein F4859DRAFT_174288 [Xylaria cf. heliscus]